MFEESNKISLQYITPHWHMGCDQICNFCYLGRIKRPNITPLEDRKKCIDIFAANNTEQMYFSGGNPMIDPLIEETLDYTKRRGILTEIVSNSWDYSRIRNLPQFLKNIDDKGATLYGSDATSHDLLSGARSSFDRIIGNLEKLSDMGAAFTLLFNVMPHNKDKLYEHLKNLRSRILYNKVWLQRIMPYGEADKNLFLQPEDLPKIYEQLARAKSDFNLAEVYFTMPPPPCQMPDFAREITDDYLRGTSFFAIDCKCRLFGESFDLSRPELALFGGRPIWEVENLTEAIAAEPQTKELFAKRFMPRKCRECKDFNNCFGGYPVRDATGKMIADPLLTLSVPRPRAR
ncbi:MAG: radical SAM protein [Rickettsiales bacterium]|jgi:MoaA/NifB/PqqE/SkfB family radical SAM enzyme|nr:radical SAM protein [Rickettsiales bacterium]